MVGSGQRVVIVTGSTVGIGRAIAAEFVANGWAVVVNARNAGDVATVTRELAAEGGTVLGIPTDVTDPDAVRAMVEQTTTELGPIDTLVNNAGIPGPRVFAQDVEAQEFLDVLRVNLWGAFLCAKYVLPGMIERGEGGRIINMTGGGAATDRPLRGGISYGIVEGGRRRDDPQPGARGVALRHHGQRDPARPHRLARLPAARGRRAPWRPVRERGAGGTAGRLAHLGRGRRDHR